MKKYKEKGKSNPSFIRSKGDPNKTTKTEVSAPLIYKMMKYIVSCRSYKPPPKFKRQSNIQNSINKNKNKKTKP